MLAQVVFHWRTIGDVKPRVVVAFLKGNTGMKGETRQAEVIFLFFVDR